MILHSLTPDQSKLTWFWVYFVKALALFLFVSHRDALTATHLQSAKIKAEQHHLRDFFWETWWKITTFCLYRDFFLYALLRPVFKMIVIIWFRRDSSFGGEVAVCFRSPQCKIFEWTWHNVSDERNKTQRHRISANSFCFLFCFWVNSIHQSSPKSHKAKNKANIRS